MRRAVQAVAIVAGLCILLAGAGAAGADTVLPFALHESAGAARTAVPVAIAGASVLERVEHRQVRTAHIRLTDGAGTPIPCQVDEKDGTGRYRNPGNGVLDADDEIVFQVDCAAGAVTRWRLEIAAEAPSVVAGEIVCTPVTFTSRTLYDICLRNPHLTVGIRGSAEEEVCAGRGKGAIMSLQPAGKPDLVWYGVCCFYSHSQADVAWSRPAAMAAGPVRGIVEVRAENVDRAFQRGSGEWTVYLETAGHFRGDILRYYTLYSRLPYLECTEVYTVRAVSPKFMMAFGFPFRTAPVSPLAREDVLYGPWQGDIHELGLAEKRFYDTQYPDEGWLAVGSPKNATGLALFYDHRKAVRAFGSLVRGYYRKHLGEKDAWLTSDLVVAYRLEDLKPGDVAANRFGLYALGGEDGPAIRYLYRALWSAPLELTWE